MFFQTYNSENGGNGAKGNQNVPDWLIVPCPDDIKDHKQH